MANTTTSTVAFSILSPDASLSYDRIKLRLEEYRTLLASDSDTIELSTENGKTVICRKKANEMQKYLDQAENLLRDVVQSRDISTLVVLHRLRDLADILDDLKLYDECRLTGNCALDLAEALSRQSFEFRHEQAETLALIAGLSVYQPRARTLLIHAVSIYEEVVANNASHSNENRLLVVLQRASDYASGHLRVEWLERAIQLMTKELPPTMVDPYLRSLIYNAYGISLHQIKQYANAIEAYNAAISICRTAVDKNPANYGLSISLARNHTNVGIIHAELRNYGGAIAAYKEALEVCTTMSTQYPIEFNSEMAAILHKLGIVLGQSNQWSEAAVIERQAIALIRNLAQAGNERTEQLSRALNNYGISCHSLGRLAEAVLAFQESILLQRTFAATDSEKENLGGTLHDVALCFRALSRYTEANAAATEALEMNHGRVFEDCEYAPDFKSCSVCHIAMVIQSLGDGLLPLSFL